MNEQQKTPMQVKALETLRIEYNKTSPTCIDYSLKSTGIYCISSLTYIRAGSTTTYSSAPFIVSTVSRVSTDQHNTIFIVSFIRFTTSPVRKTASCTITSILEPGGKKVFGLKFISMDEYVLTVHLILCHSDQSNNANQN